MPEPRRPARRPVDHPSPYTGRWIARVGDRIVGQGGTPEQAMQAARIARFKETPQISYVPTSSPLAYSDLLERVRAVLPPGISSYLVGGAVRDALRSRPVHDLDFVLSGDVLAVGRRVANALGGAFYPLDEDRDTARIVLIQPGGRREVLDFAALRGPDLESDLRGRDFTINAMAVSVNNPQALLDPLGGATDLREGILRACSPSTFQDDPVRILRGIRLAAALNFHILPETRKQMRQAASLLAQVSRERVRDELFRILDGPQAATALRALGLLDVLQRILPELMPLKGVSQSPPHVSDVWTHTLDVVQKLEILLEALTLDYDQEKVASWALGLTSVRLGRYRTQFNTHFQASLNPDRSLRALLLLAALYHDSGKPETRQMEAGGRIRFFEHEIAGAQKVSERAHELRLSNDEVSRLVTIVRHHMRPLLLAETGGHPTRRAIYRFFRDTGPAGVDICLLSLADVLGTYGPGLPQEVWIKQLDVVRDLLEAWWEHPRETIAPPALLDGHELMDLFDLKPGPQIGRLLETIREAQASGQIHDREEALALVQEQLRQNK